MSESRYIPFEAYAPKIPLGQIVARGQAPYQLTGRDLIWLARSAVFEGGDPRDVVWTEAQRFVGMRSSFATFADFIQAFSQPVNPDWRRDGFFCRPGGRYAGRKECSAAALTKRDLAASMSLTDLAKKDPEAVDIVLKFVGAGVRNPVPRATNFADEAVSAGFLANNPRAKVVKRAGNVYIMEPHAAAWDKNHVVVSRFDGALATADGVVNGNRFSQGLAVAWNSWLHPTRGART